MLRERSLLLGMWLPLMTMMMLTTTVEVTALQHCSPWTIETQKPVDHEKLSGSWYLVGREDVGIVDMRLTNAQVNITAYPWNNRYTDDSELPLWFNSPYGCCILDMEYYGRDASGSCTGRIYRWGVGLDEQPGMLKHKLMAMASYSLLYVLSTDYVSQLVIGHCLTNVDYSTYNFYCAHFNVFLLYRTKPAAATVNFDITTVQSRLQNACNGSVTFSSTLNLDSYCQYSSTPFTEPSVYEINSL